jgi:hypothetical protein
VTLRTVLPSAILFYSLKTRKEPDQATMDTTTLQMALIGYESERQKIEEKIAAIRAQLNGRTRGAGTPIAAAPAQPRKSMSAAGRKRIAAAQRKRWAEYHKKKKAA